MKSLRSLKSFVFFNLVTRLQFVLLECLIDLSVGGEIVNDSLYVLHVNN